MERENFRITHAKNFLENSEDNSYENKSKIKTEKSRSLKTEVNLSVIVKKSKDEFQVIVDNKNINNLSKNMKLLK